MKLVLKWIEHEVVKWERRTARSEDGGTHDGEARLVVCCMHAFNAFCSTADMMGPHPDESGGILGSRYGETFVLSYQHLAARSLNSGMCLFKLRPKTHYLTHVVYDTFRKYNPKKTSTWMDEDFMGKVTKVAGMCHPRTVSLRTLERMRVQYAYVWRRAAAAHSRIVARRCFARRT